MPKFLKNSLLILIIFALGLIVGIYFHSIIEFFEERVWENLSTDAQSDIYFCPPPNTVKEHQYQFKTFQVGKLYWETEYHGWAATNSIGFMQAVINKDNNLICYYQWPNPHDKGTNLWMTVHLSPSVYQKVKIYGSYWQQEQKPEQKQKQISCSAGINACGFLIKESSKRITPQEY